MTESTIAPRSYTPEEIAARWKCSPSHVRKLINRGDLRAWKLCGKLLRIRPEDVEDFEQRNAVQPPPASAETVEDHVASIRGAMADRRWRARMGL